MKRKSYPTDLSDNSWDEICVILPDPPPKGRPYKWPLREVINAILYIRRAGNAWRMLPHDFPPWQTVCYRFRAWKKNGTWELIHDALRKRLRVQEGREKEPSAGIIDSQSVKTTNRGGVCGYDAGKKSRAENVTFLSTPWALLSPFLSMKQAYRIATAQNCCSPPFSEGCLTSN